VVIDFNECGTETSRKKILHELQKLQILLRVCKDLSYLSFKRYEYASSLLNEISGAIADAESGGGKMACADLYGELCSFRNLELAYRKARKGKRSKKAVQEFEFNLEENLLQLKRELEDGSYQPHPLRQFVVMDPKTRVISASHFRDRVVHHALCNIIQPVFERTFIDDSYANRVGKGTRKALDRFDRFKRKVGKNGRIVNGAKDDNMVVGYILKADIRHYFDTVDHDVLMGLIGRRISDERILALVRKILKNHVTDSPGKGMPIGNLTSQFFANLYLNELDYFVKHQLRAGFYIRYVDDFVIMHNSEKILLQWKRQIASFLETLKLELHPEKSKVYPLHNGVNFLGCRVFYHHKLLKKSNLMAIENRLVEFKKSYDRNETTYEKIMQSLESWMAYARHANTYKLRKDIMQQFDSAFNAHLENPTKPNIMQVT